MENEKMRSELLVKWRNTVKRDIPVPLYYQLRVAIKEDIDSGVLRNGDYIPTEAELSSMLGISRPTIRQCMNDLVNDGYLCRMKGKGTYVTGPKIEMNYVAKHESFHQIIEHCGYTPTTRILDLGVVDGVATINAVLQIDPSEPLVRLRRLCMANGETMLFSESYTQANRFPGLEAFDFTDRSLYKTLEEVYHTKIVMIRREITAANACLADAKMLEIPKGRAICMVYNLAFGGDNRPVEYSISRYRNEKIKFTNYMKC